MSTVIVLGLFGALSARALSQGPGGPPGGVRGPGGVGGPGGPGGPGRHGGFGDNARPGNAPGGGTGPGGGRTALQMGPPGRWWDSPKYANSVRLTAEQQRRMDSVFSENRSALVIGLDNLRAAQAKLEVISHSDHPNEEELQKQIESVAQAHADLQKANTHLALQLRNEMTADQIHRMEDLH